MDDMWGRVGSQLLARVSGPLKFRLVLQPAMSLFFAIRSGLADARTDKPPYFWALCTNPGHREYMMKEGWKDVGKVFILAFVLDVVYQVIVLRFVYVGEAAIVALVLAIVPYLIFRGIITRLARRRERDAGTKGQRPGMRDVA